MAAPETEEIYTVRLFQLFPLTTVSIQSAANIGWPYQNTLQWGELIWCMIISRKYKPNISARFSFETSIAKPAPIDIIKTIPTRRQHHHLAKNAHISLCSNNTKYGSSKSSKSQTNNQTKRKHKKYTVLPPPQPPPQRSVADFGRQSSDRQFVNQSNKPSQSITQYSVRQQQQHQQQQHRDSGNGWSNFQDDIKSKHILTHNTDCTGFRSKWAMAVGEFWRAQRQRQKNTIQSIFVLYSFGLALWRFSRRRKSYFQNQTKKEHSLMVNNCAEIHLQSVVTSFGWVDCCCREWKIGFWFGWYYGPWRGAWEGVETESGKTNEYRLVGWFNTEALVQFVFKISFTSLRKMSENILHGAQRWSSFPSSTWKTFSKPSMRVRSLRLCTHRRVWFTSVVSHRLLRWFPFQPVAQECLYPKINIHLLILPSKWSRRFSSQRRRRRRRHRGYEENQKTLSSNDDARSVKTSQKCKTESTTSEQWKLNPFRGQVARFPLCLCPVWFQWQEKIWNLISSTRAAKKQARESDWYSSCKTQTPSWGYMRYWRKPQQQQQQKPENTRS